MEQLLQYFTPTHYQLHLGIDRHKETLAGHVVIDGAISATQPKFYLHADGLEIHRLLINGQDTSFEYDGKIITITIGDWMTAVTDGGSSKHDGGDGESVRNGEFVGNRRSVGGGEPAGNRGSVGNGGATGNNTTEITLDISFSGVLSHDMQGCYLSTYMHEGHEERIATTQFESHYARRCFPCIDEPAAKATFDLELEILDFEEGDVVLANTPLTDVSSAAHSGKTFVFERTPRMSTYLLAWVVGKFQKVKTVNKNGVRVASYAALNQSANTLDFANETAARALEYYDEKFGMPYPLPKLDQVAIPDFEAGAMENWGLVTYRESMMLAEPTAAKATKASIATTITHELSHQWFGNLVTMAWWDDLWLNESFASIMEYYCADALYPDLQVWEDFYTYDAVAALRRDALRGVQAVKQEVHSPAEIATLFDGAIVYAKGARLVLMLIHLMGEEKFHQGLRDYFRKYAYDNTAGDDLWGALQPYAEFDVKEFMHAWISQPGYPAITEDSKQRRFFLDGGTDESQWPLPEIMDDMSGHYLLQLSDEKFAEKLARVEQLTNEQKIRLLLDRSLLAKTPAVSSESLIDLIPKFANEPSGAVLEIANYLMADIGVFCQPDSEEEMDLRKFIGGVFSEAFRNLDFSDAGECAGTSEGKMVSSTATAQERAITGEKSTTAQKRAVTGEKSTTTQEEAKMAKPSEPAQKSVQLKEKSTTTANGVSSVVVDTKSSGAELDSNALRRRDVYLAAALFAHDPEVTARLASFYRDDLADIPSELLSSVLLATLRSDETRYFPVFLDKYQVAVDPEQKASLLAVISGHAEQPEHIERLFELLKQPEIVRPQSHLSLFAHLLRNSKTRERALTWLYQNWDYVEKLAGEKSIEDYVRCAASAVRTEEEAKAYFQFFDPMIENNALTRAIKVAHHSIDSRLKLIAADGEAVTRRLAELAGR